VICESTANDLTEVMGGPTYPAGGGGPVSSLLAWYNYLMVDLRDPRADAWPLMSSIWPTTTICVVYVLTVKVFGPRFMENREPYQIRGLMLVYNLFQTIFSFWMFLEGWSFYMTGEYNWVCQPVDYSDSPGAKRALSLAWWYYFSKFIDLADSLFFVARKKFTHLSPLHIIHHGTLPWLCWWGPRFVGGGQSGFGPFLNSLVHTVMYLYYFLAACNLHKYLWWKRYLTTMQMVQFVLVFLHAIQPLIFQCDYPAAASLMFAITGVQYFFLFLAFYNKAYSSKQTTKKLTEKNNNVLLGKPGLKEE